MRRALVILGWSLVLLSGGRVWATTPVMTTAELDDLLKSGQPVRGYFDSVPKGLTRKRYPITIEGVADTPFGEEIIFVSRYYIAAGMSGSPVYVRGKLLGALASSQNMFEPGIFWGGITPFEDMQKEAREGADKTHSRPPFFVYKGRHFFPIALGSQPIPEELRGELEKQGWSTSFLKTGRVIISSVASSRRGAKRSLLDRTSRRNLLRPGMPIMVDLIEWKDQTGKMNLVSALGTITFVDYQTKRVYAFGHYFLDAKKVLYTFRSAEVIGTSLSAFNSFKIAGRKSEVLGLIDRDSLKGVYGRLGLEGMEFLPRFNLELQREGKTYQKLEVTMGDSSSFLPLFFGLSLGLIGQVHGAPVADEASSTEWETQIGLKDFSPLLFRQSFSSLELKLPDRVIRRSSYDEAVESFMTGTFMPLFSSHYGFTFQKIILRANFFPYKLKQMKLAESRLPVKIVWGENPVLEIKMVGEDNALALEKKIRIPVDWSKVEVPIYGPQAPELEKDKDKTVTGFLVIFSSRQSRQILQTEVEKKQEQPDYFLGPEDFLRFFKARFQWSDRTIQGRFFFRARQLEGGEATSLSESILDQATKLDDESWRLVIGGLTRRETVVANEDLYSLTVLFPEFPSGYVADPDLKKFLTFEVVKK